MELKREGKNVTLVLLPDDIFNHTNVFRDHRQFLDYCFAKAGIKITQYHNEYYATGLIKKQGIKVGRTDSDILPQVTITVTIGLNAEEIHNDSSNTIKG